jgi:hypothetical protein
VAEPATAWPIPRRSSSALAWEAASLAVFVLALAAPAMLRAAAATSLRGLELADGALFTAAFAIENAWLPGGGKFFSAAFLVLWYAAINRIPQADFAGAFSASPHLAVSGVYVCAAIALLLAARFFELSRKG